MRIQNEAIYAMAGTVLFVVYGARPIAAQVTPVFGNEKVAVTKEVLAPGAQETLEGDHPSVVVYLSGQSAERTLAGQPRQQEKIERGKTEEEPAGAGTLRNTGMTSLIFARVKFLTEGSDAMWGASGLAPNYKVLLEDRYSRTYEIRMAAHGSEPLHSHHDRVVVCLSGARLEHILSDGSRQPSTLKTGEIAWRPAQTHSGRNLGGTDLWVIAIEPK
jgi:quercetin dioxygenase-like cupin family protein